MCLFLILLALSPRAAAILWWIVEPNRWENSFSSWIWPVLGIVFVPWTTIMWATVAPFGNANGTDWLWLGFGLLLDVSMHLNNAYRGRAQYYSGRTEYY